MIFQVIDFLVMQNSIEVDGRIYNLLITIDSWFN